MDNLIFSARKKRKVLEEEDDELLLTPKKARLSHLTPVKGATPSIPGGSRPGSSVKQKQVDLPTDLSHLLNVHTALEQAMSVALATAQISPDPDTGRVPAVLNHLSLQERGLGVKLSVDDLKRLCWIWEWDGITQHPSLKVKTTATLPNSSKSRTAGSTTAKKAKGKHKADDDSDVEGEIITEDPERNPFIIEHKTGSTEEEDKNPFLAPSPPKEWIRGGMGFCISSTSHTTRLDRSSPTKRVPAYGLGIEVDWSQEDVAGGRVGGMTAVARWTGAGSKRKKELKEKLETWLKLSNTASPKALIPVPFADIPPLPKPVTTSKLTELLTSGTPRKVPFPSAIPTPIKIPSAPLPSPSKDDEISPIKDSAGFKVPFPVMPGDRPVTPHGPRPGQVPSSGSSGGVATPSSGRSGGIRTPSFGKAAAKLAAAYTPSSDGRVTPTSNHRPPDSSLPGTPSTPQLRKAAEIETPTSARRAALYERIRAKSESEGDSVKKTAVTASVRSTEKQAPKKVTKMVGPEELRRRTLLGRLGTIAEAVWMLFASAGGGGALVTSSVRKRRALERNEVVRAVVKSSKVPISEAEAIESLTMLCELCPFFLKTKVIAGEEWLEMPASTNITPSSPGKSSPSKQASIDYISVPPGSPTRRSGAYTANTGSPSRRKVIEDELMNRSPKRIKNEEGGLRQVRERIRRELEVDEDDLFI
ncbi:hypothetical protein CPB86DRAFT_778309 [Serendipita vermifera]|nr:hypothetical protein CPB86DRAFT_778309 [Serendipita vermifera]